MSIRRLPRQMGIWVCCDGTDTGNCSQRRFTANVYVKVNRAHWAKEEGWGRGLRTDRKRRDHCPYHYKLERFLKYQQEWRRAVDKANSDETRKAKASASPLPKASALPKKPRKRKASTAVAVGAVTEAEESSIGQRGMSSRSAASAPAPCT